MDYVVVPKTLIVSAEALAAQCQDDVFTDAVECRKRVAQITSEASVLSKAIAALKTSPIIPTIDISIEGGMVQGVTLSNGACELRIYDFDIEGVDDNELSVALDGEPCILSHYGPNLGTF